MCIYIYIFIYLFIFFTYVRVYVYNEVSWTSKTVFNSPETEFDEGLKFVSPGHLNVARSYSPGLDDDRGVGTSISGSLEVFEPHLPDPSSTVEVWHRFQLKPRHCFVRHVAMSLLVGK